MTRLFVASFALWVFPTPHTTTSVGPGKVLLTVNFIVCRAITC